MRTQCGSANAIRIQCKYSTNIVQKCKYSRNTVQRQYKYSVNTVLIHTVSDSNNANYRTKITIHFITLDTRQVISIIQSPCGAFDDHYQTFGCHHNLPTAMFWLVLWPVTRHDWRDWWAVWIHSDVQWIMSSILLVNNLAGHYWKAPWWYPDRTRPHAVHQCPHTRGWWSAEPHQHNHKVAYFEEYRGPRSQQCRLLHRRWLSTVFKVGHIWPTRVTHAWGNYRNMDGNQFWHKLQAAGVYVQPRSRRTSLLSSCLMFFITILVELAPSIMVTKRCSMHSCSWLL